MEPTVFCPYPRRLKSLTVCRCRYKGSTFFSGAGHKVQGGGGWAIKIFFLSTGFQWPTPELFDKIGVAHPWSGTEKTSDPPPPTKTSNVDVDRYIREHWLTTLVR